MKPKFLFLLGVEGSGHHMLTAFLRHFFNNQNVVQHGNWHPFLFNRWDALGVIQKSAPNLTYQDLKLRLSELISQYSDDALLFSGVSFPYGRERDTLRRPDIIDTFELLSEVVEFRPIFVYRDPVSCAYSALRRGFNKNALHQARIVEDNLLYVKAQLQACELEFKSLSYEHFVEAPSQYQAALHDWWGVDSESFDAGIQELRPATEKNEIPEEVKVVLDAFFSTARLNQWADFLETNSLV